MVPQTAVRVNVCVFGSGPAAAISAWMARQATSSVLWVGGEWGGLLRPFRHGCATFNPFPVFPVRESPVYHRLGLHQYAADASDVQAHEWGDWRDKADATWLPKSLLAYQAAQGAGRGMARSLKLFGPKAGERPLPLVQAKFTAHYGPERPQWTRVGYVKGLSVYTHWMLGTSSRPDIHGAVSRLDLPRRVLSIGDVDIAYDLLIACVPLPDLLKVAGMVPQLAFDSGEARFSVFCAAEFTVANHLLYDDRSDSPFYRVFVPLEQYVIVQFAAGRTPESVDYTRLWEKFGVRMANWVADLHVPTAYPLGPDGAAIETTRSDLRALGVVLCGRLAEWRYIDLHEVDWGAIRAAVEH